MDDLRNKSRTTEFGLDAELMFDKSERICLHNQERGGERENMSFSNINSCCARLIKQLYFNIVQTNY